MRAAVLIAILAFAAVANASRVNVMGLRSILSYHDDDGYEHKEPKYCKDWKKHSDCHKDERCVHADKPFCKYEEHCTGYGKDKHCDKKKVCWEYWCEKPKYCKDWKKHSDCHKDQWCVHADKPFCKYEHHCTGYGKHKHCDYKKVCWEYWCVDKPKYCKDWKKHTDCHKNELCVHADEPYCKKEEPHCTGYGKDKKCDYKEVCWEYWCVKPKYCKDWKEHSDCHKDEVCVPLDKPHCKEEPHCEKDPYGKDDCDYKEECWKYHCVEKPAPKYPSHSKYPTHDKDDDDEHKVYSKHDDKDDDDEHKIHSSGYGYNRYNG